MSGFIEGENRYQSVLFPERVDDYIEEDSVVRVIDLFIDRLDISGLGFKVEAAEMGRPRYHPRRSCGPVHRTVSASRSSSELSSRCDPHFAMP